MESRINEIINLEDGSKYMIIDQGVYNMKNYFFTTKLDVNGDLTDNFSVSEEIIENEEHFLTEVEDKRLFKALVEYFQIRNRKED